MTAVDTKQAISYGFEAMTYLIVTFLFSVVLLVVGAIALSGAIDGPGTDPNIVLIMVGLLAAVFGFAIFWAGLLGMLYKVIADGVHTAAKG